MFKLICALGNSDKENIKALVKLYAKAGAWMFDVSPYALDALNEAVLEEGLDPCDFKYCISLPVGGDIHGRKAKINQKKCKKCSKCEKGCLQAAISAPQIDENKCIGCGICEKKCPHNALKLYDKTDYFIEFKKILKSSLKLDCIELHASVNNEKLILKTLDKICKKFKGEISLCISRRVFSTEQAFSLIKKAKKIASDNADFYIQADGNSMNGANAQLASTLECAAFASALKGLGIDEKKIILSGGVNEYTKKLCNDLSLSPLALAFGTYARVAAANVSLNEAQIMAGRLVAMASGVQND